MKKTLLTLVVLGLVGCASPVPVTMKFPSVPEGMLKSCPDLQTVDPNTKKLSEVVEIVVNNYQTYYDCKDQSNDWIEWYTTQKKIYESVK
jgi:hypothetical protein